MSRGSRWAIKRVPDAGPCTVPGKSVYVRLIYIKLYRCILRLRKGGKDTSNLSLLKIWTLCYLYIRTGLKVLLQRRNGEMEVETREGEVKKGRPQQ